MEPRSRGARLLLPDPHLAPGWAELRAVTEEIAKIIGIRVDPASWNSPWFYYPAVPKARRSSFQADRTALERSTWTPKPFEPVERKSTSPSERRVGSEEEARISGALDYIDNYDRETWLQVGAALHSTGLPNAKEIWDEWSAEPESDGAPKYDQDDQDRTWEGFDADRPDRVTVGTIYHLAREEGWPGGAGEKSDPREDFRPYLVTGGAPDSAHSQRRGAEDMESEFRRMNERYAVVLAGSKVRILLERPNPTDFEPARELLTERDFHLLERPNVVFMPKKKDSGETVEVQVSQRWLGWRDRPPAPTRRTREAPCAPHRGFNDLGPLTVLPTTPRRSICTRPMRAPDTERCWWQPSPRRSTEFGVIPPQPAPSRRSSESVAGTGDATSLGVRNRGTRSPGCCSSSTPRGGNGTDRARTVQ